MLIPTIKDIYSAGERIKPYIHRTPVLTSSAINMITGCELFFKCENFQKGGAFKFRGATNVVLSMFEDEASKGVATHSSGNFAQALALAARQRGIKATIIMPDNSPNVKKNAVADYGADIIFCKPTLEARESTLNKFVSETGAVFIHPYNHFNVICGQGTATLELLEEIQDLDYIICPVGGGGLLSGTLIAANTSETGIKVIAAEPEGADDAFRSLEAGYIIPSVDPNTICDGLLTSLGSLTFEIIKDRVHKIVTVSDDSVRESLKLIFQRMKIVVEPSAAITLGLILEKKIDLSGKRAGLILSGGNIDLSLLNSIFKE